MDMKEMEERKKMADFMLDMLCEATGDKSILYFREAQKFGNRLSMENSITDKQYDKLTLIIKEFNNKRI